MTLGDDTRIASEGDTLRSSAMDSAERVGRVGDTPSISGDGSAIAFSSVPYVLPEYAEFEGVFVATALSLSHNSLEIPPAGGTFVIDVAAPATAAKTRVTIRVACHRRTRVAGARCAMRVRATLRGHSVELGKRGGALRGGAFVRGVFLEQRVIRGNHILQVFLP